ncbi:hypothetical protein O3P69_005489 [Scylla paramamosain]|uniref:Uncharacterized protein n=1 Tax=Scylla paramamosain TaxID=85552 RepID=A0AAW0UBZ1_SCYPA
MELIEGKGAEVARVVVVRARRQGIDGQLCTKGGRGKFAGCRECVRACGWTILLSGKTTQGCTTHLTELTKLPSITDRRATHAASS